MREIFENAAAEKAEQESFKTQRYVTFKNVTPDYYGDYDDEDQALLAAERAQEERGASTLSCCCACSRPQTGRSTVSIYSGD